MFLAREAKPAFSTSRSLFDSLTFVNNRMLNNNSGLVEIFLEDVVCYGICRMFPLSLLY